MAKYLLHGRNRSGNTYKISFYLNAAGLDWQPVVATPAETMSAEWRARVNPMGEVPVLETDGRFLTQSGAILMELARTTGAFAPKDDLQWNEALRWILWDNHKFTSHWAAYRFGHSFATTKPAPDVLAFLKSQSDLHFGVLERTLADRRFVLGDTPTVVDFSLAGYVYYPESEWGYAWRPSHPNIAFWANRLAELPGWKPPYEIFPSAPT